MGILQAGRSRAVGPEESAQPEEYLEVVPPVGEAGEPLLGGGPLPQLLADHELGVDQLQGGVAVGRQGGALVQQLLGATAPRAQAPLQLGTRLAKVAVGAVVVFRG